MYQSRVFRFSEATYSMTFLSKTEFEIIEGIFHDGLGTYAELQLANLLIKLSRSRQQPFDLSRSQSKMQEALKRLPPAHPSKSTFEKEISNITKAAETGAEEITSRFSPATLTAVKHVARDFVGAKAADLLLEFSDHPLLPISVKTDKSGKVAIAEGQTPDIGPKWAFRFFRVSTQELDAMIREIGFSTMTELKLHYLNVAQIVARVLIRKLGLVDYNLDDFSRARVTNLDAAKYLFHQLLRFKQGSDGSQVIVFDRSTAEVKWESLLDAVDIDSLTTDRISLRPSRPRKSRPVGSEFGVKIDGKAVATFQVKHKRGAARETARRNEFSDITTRLVV